MNTPSISQKSLLISFLCLASIACDNGKEVPEYNIKEKIDQYWPRMLASDSLKLSQFDVCQLFPESGWDRVHIVRPYTSLDKLRKLDLNNFSRVKDKFRHFKYGDRYVGFLFVKKQDIISYSISTREINFDGVSGFTKAECQNLRVKRHAPPDTTHFYVVLLNKKS